MKLPTSFPVDDMNMLIDFFANRDAHTVRDYIEAAYGVEGFALSCLLGKQTTVTKTSVENMADGQKFLENARDACTGKKGSTAGAGMASIDWNQILAIIVAILQQVIPLIS